MRDENFVQIDMRVLFRNLLYDARFSEVEVITRGLGLPPISDEGVESELRNSEERLDRIANVEPVLAVCSSWLSTASAIGPRIVDADDPETVLESSLTDEDRDNISVFSQWLFMGTRAAIASLVDTGFLTVASFEEASS